MQYNITKFDVRNGKANDKKLYVLKAQFSKENEIGGCASPDSISR